MGTFWKSVARRVGLLAKLSALCTAVTGALTTVTTNWAAAGMGMTILGMSSYKGIKTLESPVELIPHVPPTHLHSCSVRRGVQPRNDDLDAFRVKPDSSPQFVRPRMRVPARR